MDKFIDRSIKNKMKNLKYIRKIKTGFESRAVTPLVEQGCSRDARFIVTGCSSCESAKSGYPPVSVKPERLLNYPSEMYNSRTERKHSGTLCLPASRTRQWLCMKPLSGHKLAEMKRKEVYDEKICGKA